jgi:biotin transport system substrate-specific component
LLSVGGFCLLVALLAQVRVPLPGTPVPMTLQVLGVLLAGMFLGPFSAGAAMGLYVFCGVFYSPMFAVGSAGLGGVTGGYLMGFVPAAALVAWAGGRCGSMLRCAGAGALGTATVLGCGVAWQCMWFDYPFPEAFALGVLPFLPKAVVQLAVAVALTRALRGGASGL